MSTKTIKSTNLEYPNLQLLVIDTEGLGGISSNIQQDSKIFLISILMSSLFIYNSCGTIDEKSIQDLGLIVNMAKQLESKKLESK